MPDTRDPELIAERLRAALLPAPDERVYGIVDATIDRDLAQEARLRDGARTQSLFLPEVADALWDVAPYLVEVDRASPFLDRWARRWGSSAGVLLTARADFDTLAAHLRSIFVVKDETGQEYFFRFYDPRVLHSFLPTCSPAQLGEFFGPITKFACESPDAGAIAIASLDGTIVAPWGAAGRADGNR